MTMLEWVAVVPGHLPDQAVMFENHPNKDAKFVAKVPRKDGKFQVGLFVSDGACAEYALDNIAWCTDQFALLVLKHGKSVIWLLVATEYLVSFLRSTISNVFSNCFHFNLINTYQTSSSVIQNLYAYHYNQFLSTIRSSDNDSTGSGHQVCCILWLQMDTFNKEIGFLCGLKFFALNIFLGNTCNRVYI